MDYLVSTASRNLAPVSAYLMIRGRIYRRMANNLPDLLVKWQRYDQRTVHGTHSQVVGIRSVRKAANTLY